MMKKFAFALLVLAALAFPPHVLAQQAVFTPTSTAVYPWPTRGARTTTPVPTQTLTPTPTMTGMILSATPTVTGTLSATLAATSSPTMTLPSGPSGTALPGASPTQNGLASATAFATPTSATGPAAASCVSTAGEPACPLTAQTGSSSIRVSLGTGINPASVDASLLDTSGQLIAKLPVDASGTLSLQIAAGNYTLRLSEPGHLPAQKTVSLLAGQPLEISAASLPAGDINADSSIDALDLISLGAAYDTNRDQQPAADLNGDGVIDLLDLTLLAKNWRETGPINW